MEDEEGYKMDEIERQKLLKDLNKLHKELSDYERRQERHSRTKFTEGQKKSLNDLRIRIRNHYHWLKDTISKYGGSASIKVVGRDYDALDYSLKPLYMLPEHFTALQRAVNTVNTAIRELESITIETIDWRDIRVPKPIKKQPEGSVYLLGITQLHPKVIEASKSLFETGHYAQAIFEAFKAVNNSVKEKTSSPLDGKDLMAKVFREENPIIKLNELKTKSEKDEQEGFKFLFMGAMVGIRNPEAHDSVIQTDPNRTLEYLGFASLLMKRVEEGTVETEKNDQTL